MLHSRTPAVLTVHSSRDYPTDAVYLVPTSSSFGAGGSSSASLAAQKRIAAQQSATEEKVFRTPCLAEIRRRVPGAPVKRPRVFDIDVLDQGMSQSLLYSSTTPSKRRLDFDDVALLTTAWETTTLSGKLAMH